MAIALADAVGTLRIRTSSDDPATRMGCAGAVRRARLTAGGTSPRAVLVLRKVSVHPVSLTDPGSIEAQLAGCVEAGWRAARPPGLAALTADAVVFPDLTSLLALYLADLAAGRVGERWWWSALSLSLPGAGDARSVLVAHIELVPHVVVELRGRRELDRVVAKLDAAACTDLVGLLAARFAAPHLAGIAAEVRQAAANGSPAAAGAREPAVPTRRLLVAVASRLAEDPAEARSNRFAREAVREALAVRADGDHRDWPPALEPVRPEPPAAATEERNPVTGTPSVPSGEARIHRCNRSGGRALVEPHPPESPPSEQHWPGASAGAREEDRTAQPEDRPLPPGPAAARRWDDPPSYPVTDGAQAAGNDLGAGVVTELGGVFFLIELVRALRLPERFGAGGRFADRVGWWGTIELVARRLLPSGPALAADPVWGVLTELGGGRSVHDRARALRAADTRAVEPWDEGHVPAGILPLDASLSRTSRGVVRHWLEYVGPRLAAILADRLRCGPEDLAVRLLSRPAVIVHDRTHVDVHLPASSATAAVRRVGFDRDPGWVPELGRVIAFHFDDSVAGG